MRLPTLRLRRSPTCEASDRFGSHARHPVGDHRSPVVRVGLWRFRVIRGRHRHDDHHGNDDDCPARHGTGRDHHDRTGEHHDDHGRRVRRPPGVFYAVGENVCSVDGNAPCADDPRNIYVNETIGFSFAFDDNWRRLGTDTDGRIQLVHEYFVPGDPFIVVSWEPTMGRTLDMFADDLIAPSDPDAIGAWDWATDELGGFEWESAEGLFLNAMSVPFTPTRTRGRRSSSSPSARAWRSARSRRRRRCRFAVEPDRRDDPRHLDMVGAGGRRSTSATCSAEGGTASGSCGSLRTRIECALVRGETYLFRVEVAEGQTLTAGVSSVRTTPSSRSRHHRVRCSPKSRPSWSCPAPTPAATRSSWGRSEATPRSLEIDVR